MTIFQGSFQTPTTLGSFSVTGLGFKPTAVLFISNPISGTTPGTITEARVGFGVACKNDAGDIEQWVVSSWRMDAGTINDHFSSDSQAHCLRIHTNAATILFDAALTSLDNDGFTLNFTTVDASDYKQYYLAINAEEADFKAGTFQTGTDVTKSVTGVGFEPSLVIFAHNWLSSSASSGISVGFDNGSPTNRSPGMAARFRPSGGDVSQFRGLGRAMRSMLRGASGDNDSSMSRISSFTTDGFDLTRVLGSAPIDEKWCYLAMAGIASSVETLPLDPATTDIVFPIAAEAMLVIGPNGPIEFGDATFGGNVGEGFTIGWCSPSKSHSSAIEVVSSVGPVYVADSISSDTLVANAVDGIPTLTASSFTEDGVHLVRSGGAGAAQFGYCVIGVDPAYSKSGQKNFDDDMELRIGETHYMTIIHKASGVATTDWITTLLRNGEQITHLPIDIQEKPNNRYVFSFINDGPNDSTWTLAVSEPAFPNERYVYNWHVTNKIVEAGVRQIRQRMDTGGLISGK